MALYEFDNELRQLLFSAIQRIEVALRSKIIQYFSMQHGAFWFMKMDLHCSASLPIAAPTSYKVAQRELAIAKLLIFHETGL